MDLIEWTGKVSQAVYDRDQKELHHLSKGPYKKMLHHLNRFFDHGSYIYEKDWDLLVIVDACRYDLAEIVSNEYSFGHSIGSTRSVASVTRRWMQENFSDEFIEEMTKTTYICGNPYSDSELKPEYFRKLVEVWRDNWEEPGTVPPRAITDATVEIGREANPERVIAHYMQPHCPFIDEPQLSRGKQLEAFGNQSWDDVWQRLEKGHISKSEVWDGYKKNLRRAFDEVEVLIENFDADTVIISSDHGNALGEWGLYGHPEQMPFQCLRKVPYIELSSEDKKTRTDLTHLETNEQEVNVEKRLKALGYK
jgi:hypothetical protein